MSTGGWIVLGVIVAVVVWLIATYNGLVSRRNQSQNAWSQIDVQLKRRHDLIPNLVQVVKDAMSYEQETLKTVIEARNRAVAATGPAQASVAEAALSEATGKLLMLMENYPTLKANDNVMQLQEELTTTENKISFARQFYNDSVMALNNAVQSFPGNLIAGRFGFTIGQFFDVPETEKAVPQVKLR
ncbi:LemA family protein [Reyranella sp. CPCC 100927]|uniref:LemA family protein n=1 Tax=Reyranella sp. CPCC 100927 TaxID=2599616 RepID=UPI0011B58C07|nr:LemA family protein [Reyranella sp. CPCC 100927]TWT15640.1 LemA family protein [Reyranella sp. CPCC 100927]